jgi:hypothetical protein
MKQMRKQEQPMRILGVLIKKLVIISLVVGSGAVMADATPADGKVEISTNYPVSANKAKRIVRHYLAKQGYSRAIGPGGASIRGVQLDMDQWIVEVFLRDRSATSGGRYTISVHTGTGLLSQITAAASGERG